MLHFEFQTWIQATPGHVWAFHERDDIFDLLAPPGPKPQVLLRKGKLRTGSRVEFLVPIGPLKVKWLALHVNHEDGLFFTDEQIRGPFRYWLHEHRFEPENGGTRLVDRIRCSLPLGPLSDWVVGWLVGLQVKSMFRHRHAVTKRMCEQS
ncbi:MAG: SRPBCC family protein [Bryobacterales bacterium]|nr:SRPBCC family protein [Bryobacterales bacterium]